MYLLLLWILPWEWYDERQAAARADDAVLSSAREDALCRTAPSAHSAALSTAGLRIWRQEEEPYDEQVLRHRRGHDHFAMHFSSYGR